MVIRNVIINIGILHRMTGLVIYELVILFNSEFCVFIVVNNNKGDTNKYSVSSIYFVCNDIFIVSVT